MNLGMALDVSVNRYPNRIAVVQENQELSYAQLNDKVLKVAASLQRVGVVKNDRVIVILKNRVENYVVYWALQKLGAIYTPINYRLSAKEVEYCVNDAEAKVVIYENASQNAVLGAEFISKPILIGIDGVIGVDIYYSELINRSPGSYQECQINENDISIMLYTSGTTGRPKGVPRTHKNEYSAAMAHIIQNQYVLGESTLGTMPLYHTMGIRSLISMVLLNGKFAILPDFDAEAALKILSKEKISSLYLIPTLYHDILSHKNFDKYDLTSLKKIGYAGAPMTTDLVQKCIDKLNPAVFVNHYGSTEIYTFTICPHVPDKPGSAGKAGIHEQVNLVVPDPDGHSTPKDIVRKGEVGEIIVNLNSNEAFKGYWNRPDATQKAIRDGWYFTGDLGVQDDDGDLFVVGRVDDMIISGGENIHPIEVEDTLSLHPKVDEVVIIGELDERWGQIVTAYIVPKDPTLTIQELDEFCKSDATLTNFKRPRKYVFIKEVPKSAVGKILRRKLRNGEFEVYEKEVIK
ncbi:class I adenylate-forming enzyme family protein [Halalkalibacter nanhaiisediminis]|uniref:2-furoate---CoA ligase n=1 Tax=Halalkalibacter nanhaiisediminis TaxID=688079 RepID=A0A562QN20_9BACI|nr:AMP-binding protein [Halalkalibacter nanhaiisediminis]TWI58148.1 2-furoate---CoA ligase [Halalkalibacter nanhaiisediminis]